MASQLEILQELERRGKLPDVYKPLLDAARQEGLIQSTYEQPAPPPGVMVHTQGQGIGTPEQEKQFQLNMEAKKRAQNMGGYQPAAPMLEGLGMGWGNEIAGGMAAPLTAMQSGNSMADEAKINSRTIAELNQREHAANPGRAMAGELGGAVMSGLAGPALAPFKAAGPISGTVSSIANAMLTGGAYGGAYGAGAAKPGERLEGVATGATTGAITGGVAQGAINVLTPAARVISSRIRPRAAKDRFVGELVKRSGKSVDDITNEMQQAAQQGQGDVYTLADALGHPGQRAASVIARTPNEGRTKLVDALNQRQAGASRRVTGQLAEAFNGKNTAQQVRTALKGARSADAAKAYRAAEDAAGPVNLTGAINTIDDLLGRNPIFGPQNEELARQAIGKKLMGIRKQLTNDKKNLIDFRSVLNVKSDMYEIIKGLQKSGKSVPEPFMRVYKELDKALEGASDLYRAANDQFRNASKVIEAVDTGKSLSTGRRRYEDVIDAFNKMTPEQKAAARVGYVDPQIAKVQSNTFSRNPAYPFWNEASKREFAAIGGNKGRTLNQQIEREMAMAETKNQALANSSTAQNQADIAEFAGNFDPSIIAPAMAGNFKSAIHSALVRGIAELQGVSPGVASRLADDLLTTSPPQARQILVQGLQSAKTNEDVRQAISRAIAAMSAGAMVGGQNGQP